MFFMEGHEGLSQGQRETSQQKPGETCASSVGSWGRICWCLIGGREIFTHPQSAFRLWSEVPGNESSCLERFDSESSYWTVGLGSRWAPVWAPSTEEPLRGEKSQGRWAEKIENILDPSQARGPDGRKMVAL